MENNDLEKIEVIVNRELFRSDDNFYSAYSVTLNDVSAKNLTITGYMPQLSDGQIVSLSGTYVMHSRYGLQFSVQSILPVSINTENSFIKYLSSSQFSGIGKIKASRILEYYGLNFFENVLNDENFEMDDSFLSYDEQQMILETIRSQDNLFKIINFFYRFGISMQLTMKIQAKYKDKAIDLIEENPYRLIQDISGIGFSTVDKIALSLNFKRDDPLRIQAILVYETMQLCLKSGSTYCQYEELAASCFRYGLNSMQFEQNLIECFKQQTLINPHDDLIYHKTQYDAEVANAQFLVHAPFKAMTDDLLDLDSLIDDYEKTNQINFDETQKEAIRLFFNSDKLLITGGPGTGKTTIIQAIISLLRHNFPTYSIACCAPTGRASKRLKDIVNIDVTTIHSLLEYNLETNSFGRNQTNPLNVDILIIDEYSMVDNYVMGALSRALSKVRKVLFIGDKDQLPSVGCGFLIRDILESSVFEIATLTHNYRQQQGSNIINLAQQINNQKFNFDFLKHDVTFIPESHHCQNTVLELFKNSLEQGYKLEEIQVLASKYDGVDGIDAINLMLQNHLNPPQKNKREIKFGYITFRERDKVLQLKNQPDDHVYNGDIGYIVEIVTKEESDDRKNHVIVDFEGIIVEYTAANLYHLKHAYCMSVHKAQGSQYPVVIFVASTQHRFMLSKRLIYTAITRAANKLYLVGHQDTISKAILKDPSQAILTQLKELISLEISRQY